MTINEFIMKYREVDQRDYRGTELEYSYEDGVMTMIRNPCVVCKDGFTFSAQASSTHYSDPKGYADEYTEIEIGFPSSPEPLISKYAEDWEIEGDDDPRLCETVYGYVPVKTVDLLIKKHGGIDEDAVTEKMKKAA